MCAFAVSAVAKCDEVNEYHVFPFPSEGYFFHDCVKMLVFEPETVSLCMHLFMQ